MSHFRFHALLWGGACAALLSMTVPASAQRSPKTKPSRESILTSARTMMAAQPYCALVTVDKSGGASIRTMNPFPPDADMAVYFATDDRSQKVLEIQKDPRVTLYYANHQKAEGFVALRGKATLVTDPAEIQKRKRAYWDQAFPGFKHLLLIKIVPVTLEIICYKDGLVADPQTSRPPTVEFESPQPDPDRRAADLLNVQGAK